MGDQADGTLRAVSRFGSGSTSSSRASRLGLRLQGLIQGSGGLVSHLLLHRLPHPVTHPSMTFSSRVDGAMERRTMLHFYFRLLKFDNVRLVSRFGSGSTSSSRGSRSGTGFQGLQIKDSADG